MKPEELKLIVDALMFVNWRTRKGKNKAKYFKLKERTIRVLNNIGLAKFNGYYCNIRKDGSRAYLAGYLILDKGFMLLCDPEYFCKITNLGEWRSKPETPPKYMNAILASQLLDSFLGCH